jgi:hypothetical protein
LAARRLAAAVVVLVDDVESVEVVPVDVVSVEDVSVVDVGSDDEPLPSHAYAAPTPNPRHSTTELAPTAIFRPRTLCTSDSFRESLG